MPRTWKQLADEALQVQDACNRPDERALLVKLTNNQKWALIDMGLRNPLPVVAPNAWTCGCSLIRKGLASKLATSDLLTECGSFGMAPFCRNGARAAYLLTPKGLEEWEIIKLKAIFWIKKAEDVSVFWSQYASGLAVESRAPYEDHARRWASTTEAMRGLL